MDREALLSSIRLELLLFSVGVSAMASNIGIYVKFMRKRNRIETIKNTKDRFLYDSFILFPFYYLFLKYITIHEPLNCSPKVVDAF